MKKQQRFTRSAIALACVVFILPSCTTTKNNIKSTTSGEWIADPNSGCKVRNETPKSKMKSRDFITWSGACGANGLAQGFGTLTWFTGEKYDAWYDGNYVDGKMHGKGIYLTTDNFRYDGDWSDNMMNGKGVVLLNGNRYEGEFKNNKPNGKGIAILKTGERHEGEWKMNGDWESGNLTVVSKEPEVTGEASMVTSIDPIPNQYLIKSKNGCKLLNINTSSTEEVFWSGKCKDGYANGPGKLTWYKNGKINSELETYFENGLYMNPSSNFNNFIFSENKKCGFALPISGIDHISHLFEVRFQGSCPKNNGSATILFQGKFFAKYKGDLDRGHTPVGGELTFYTGSKFIFKNKISSTGLVNKDLLSKWAAHIDLQRFTSSSNNLGLKDNFDISIGFNSKPVKPKERTESLLIFSIDTTSTSNTIKINYNVTPVNIKKLTEKSYILSLKIEMPIEEKNRVFGFSQSERRSIFKNIDLIVERRNGYKSSGEVLFAELDTYFNANVVEVTNRPLNPIVSIFSIVPN